MDKNCRRFFVSALIAVACFLLSACDSLWVIPQSTDITFNVNVNEIMGALSSRSALSIEGNVQSGTQRTFDTSTALSYEDADWLLRVSLYDASNDLLIEKQPKDIGAFNPETDNTDFLKNIKFVFNEVRLGINVYAIAEGIATYNGVEQIEGVFHSNETTVRIGENNLVFKLSEMQYPLYWRDSAFEAAVRRIISKPNGHIMISDVATITNLDLSNSNITNLYDIRYFTSLTTLNVTGNNGITDWSPVSHITNVIGRPVTEIIVWQDSAFEAEVREELKKPTGDIMTLDVAGMSSLHLYGSNITNIGDIVHFTGLTNLALMSFPAPDSTTPKISDISPLAGLTNLTSLTLSSNQISDITPLAGLTNLTSLNLSDNQITDVSPLASLINLTHLYLTGNEGITDWSPVSHLVDTLGNSLNERIQWIDSVFEATIRTLLNKPEGDILRRDVMNITDLDLSNSNITEDIHGIRYFTGLTSLDLSNNQITGTLSLDDLKNLTNLNLSNNQITNIWLRGLTNLTQLDFSNNQFSYIWQLNDLTSLTDLNLSNNQITDISGLANLTKLTNLDLSGNSGITDWTPVGNIDNVGGRPASEIIVWQDSAFEAAIRETIGKPNGDIMTLDVAGMTYLDLDSNDITKLDDVVHFTGLWSFSLWNNSPSSDSNASKISDISPLTRLPNLTKVHLYSYQISDINDLADLPNLTSLSLSNSQISDISVLTSLPNLTSLHLDSNQITDITVLANLPNLTSLSLSDNKISDMSVLATLTNLTSLNLSGSKIGDISVLANLTNLTSLWLSNNQISDINGLSSFTKLTNLGLINNQITNLSPLANLTNVTSLYLDSNQITNVSPLASLTNLTSLWLSNNQITDLSPLANLTNATYLYLSNNQITDLSPLANLPNLTHLDLTRNDDITDWTPVDHIVDAQENALNETIYFAEDSAFKAAIRTLLNKPEDYILRRDVVDITNLDLSNKNITNLYAF